MKSLSSLGLGLSLVFGCLLLALLAELYYLLWWKKKIIIINRDLDENVYKSCWKRPSSLSSKDICSSDTQVHEPQAHHHQSHDGGDSSNKDFWYKPFGNGEDEEEDGIIIIGDEEIMRGPPRFLFTIKEETKEDLESEDGKSRSRKRSRSKSLSDLFHIIETPYLTPLASPPYFTPPLTPLRTSSSPNTSSSFFGSSTSEAEFNWLRSFNSPPPNFNFFKDDEDKLVHTRKGVESSSILDEENGHFITLLIGKNKEEEGLENYNQNVVQYIPSSSSQVLPLAS